ncbi:TerD family protein [Streptomyces sp. NBC_01498]|uniref:TerD family protein n=1 Tax=Streptomyces sp. NBC_01498 TaxID=2975870 RepID=UPI002E7B9B24|nr:TerD family protein [Streptomyces sp. NBC_01498]WTL28849.1 TerD family protein [Streptomyces sp. NBC_01498]
MVKGANTGLAALSENAESVRVGLSWSSEEGDGDADVSVLLLGDRGKVRGDADFLFYNNPVAADGSVQLLGKTPTDSGSEDRISLDLHTVAPDVERVVVAASRYENGRFGDLHDLRLTVADGAGEDLLGFSIDDAGAESAFVFGEFYRRGAEWKFRAVGQGYETGLAGLATDFGIDVDDAEQEPEQEPESAPESEAGSAPEQGTEPEADRNADADPGDAGTAGAESATGTRAARTTNAAGAAGDTAPGSATIAPVPLSADSVLAAASTGAPAPVSATVPAQVPREATPPGTTEHRPATAPATAPSAEAPSVRRPRTVKKRVTLPKVAKKSLAENDSWRAARLFPVPSLKNDRERETRATSVLLSVMTQVPEFGRRLTAPFGAPVGRMETFTEVSLPHGESPKRPDGVIRVERAGKLWTALVETKTNGNPLKTQQVQDYMDIAARRGYEAVITLCNDVALEGSPLVDVRVDGRRKHKVVLRHLSWAEVAHQAQMLIRHEGVGNAAHAWLLQELLHYLQHENSGCHGFQNMGPAWVPVRRSIDDETLCQGDPRAVDVVESWERLVRQVCLRLGGELGQKVLPVRRVRRTSDSGAVRAAQADLLCHEGRLTAELRIEGTPGILALTADLRTGKLRTSIDLPAPDHGSPLVSVKRLIRQLADAPADLHVQTLLSGGPGGDGDGPRGTLERLRPEPGDLLPRGEARSDIVISGFRLSLFKSMGNTRGTAESGFIRSVDDAVDRFCASVVAPLERRPVRRAQVDRQGVEPVPVGG